ncbi:hypothetical protein AVEN_104677-1 [Araneus ventricosus]|uniref:Uncharacterized protein n=1 Tax=Araneus ventricosus TaxID=182803 RepID=A0A4Y2BDZ6_ARAVE|nr:hypothetical protein AVEN_104677-1 [Araneus ventricosus]
MHFREGNGLVGVVRVLYLILRCCSSCPYGMEKPSLCHAVSGHLFPPLAHLGITSFRVGWASNQGPVNDSLCNSSSTEAGVLMAITGHGPAPPEGDRHYHLRSNTTLTFSVPAKRSENPLAYPAASDPRTRGATPGGVFHP